MKVLLVGGGIASLSTAYYIKKLALPVSQVNLNFSRFYSSSKFLLSN